MAEPRLMRTAPAAASSATEGAPGQTITATGSGPAASSAIAAGSTRPGTNKLSAPADRGHGARCREAVFARYIRNDRLTDALMAQAFTALSASPGARALYDAERARGAEHNPALCKVANRLVGILHGCFKTRTLYDEATAWPSTKTSSPLDIQAPGISVKRPVGRNARAGRLVVRVRPTAR